MDARRSDPDDLPGRYARLELMSHGYNRRAGEIVSSKGPPTVRAFGYHYEIGFGQAHESCDWTVAVAETDADTPGVWIGRYREMIPIGLFERYDPMVVQAAPPVASRVVYTESPRWVNEHLVRAFWDLLEPAGDEQQGSFDCELRGPYLALYHEGEAGPSFQLDMVSRARALAASLERPQDVQARGSADSSA
jgi:hypothetical protein